MNSIAIEKFYFFFQGVIVFQAFFLLILYFMTKRKDVFFYSIFLFFSAAYFLLNAPNTFFGLNDEIVFGSDLYRYWNIPLIIISNLFYILFLKSFFSGLYKSKVLDKSFTAIFVLTPFLIISFFLLLYLGYSRQPIFYIANLLATFVSLYIIIGIFKNRAAQTGWVATGMLFNIMGTSLTMLMIVLDRYGIHNILTVDYPLIFMRFGILADIFFYQVAILKKWHFQEKELAIQPLKNQLAVEKVRNQISRELHDDIGATLSGISMYSHIAQTQAASHQSDAVNKSLKVIQQGIQEMVARLQDIVWSVDPKQECWETLFDRLQEYALLIASAQNIQLQFECSAIIKHADLLPENRHNIYLLCKEAINNAIKYSEASILTISAVLQNNNIVCVVADNGKGFDIDNIKRGNGLTNMQKRADEIGAKLNIVSSTGKGTVVLLEINVND